MKDKIFLLVAPALAFAASLVNAMAVLAIPLTSAAPALVVLGVMLVGLSVGSLVVLLSSRPRLRALYVLLITVVIIALLDQIIKGHTSLHAIDGWPLRIAALTALTCVIFGIVWVVRAAAPTLLFAGASALFASTLVMNAAALFPLTGEGRQTERVSDAGNNLAPVIYVVLDEMVGLKGIDRNVPGGVALHDVVSDLLIGNGFRVYPRAFSRHVNSSRSIPNTLNFDEQDDGYGVRAIDYVKQGGAAFDFAPLQLLENAKNAGYRVGVHQSAHMNFCSAIDVAECVVFPSFNPTSQYVYGGAVELGDAVSELAIQLRASQTGSYSYSRYLTVLARLLGHGGEPAAYYDVHGFARWFDRVADDIQQNGRGWFSFVHLIAPHGPHLLNGGCQVVREWFDPYNLAEVKMLSDKELTDTRQRNMERYFAQTECVTSKLRAFLSAIARDPAFADATIVIHGDHGSRISNGFHAESLSDQTLIDNYSTLYAIKRPGVEPGADDRLVSVQRATAEFFSGKSETELGPQNDSIAVDSLQNDEVILVRMPSGW